MEMQFFILGHIILFVMCMGVGATMGSGDDSTNAFIGSFVSIFALFIPLEIIYWGLHWWLIP